MVYGAAGEREPGPPPRKGRFERTAALALGAVSLALLALMSQMWPAAGPLEFARASRQDPWLRAFEEMPLVISDHKNVHPDAMVHGWPLWEHANAPPGNEFVLLGRDSSRVCSILHPTSPTRPFSRAL